MPTITPARSPAPTRRGSPRPSTPNVGTAKTLTPAGTVIDGNGGANYAITFVNDTGVITGRRHHRHRDDRHQDLRRHHRSAAIPTITAAPQPAATPGVHPDLRHANVGTGKT